MLWTANIVPNIENDFMERVFFINFLNRKQKVAVESNYKKSRHNKRLLKKHLQLLINKLSQTKLQE